MRVSLSRLDSRLVPSNKNRPSWLPSTTSLPPLTYNFPIAKLMSFLEEYKDEMRSIELELKNAKAQNSFGRIEELQLELGPIAKTIKACAELIRRARHATKTDNPSEQLKRRASLNDLYIKFISENSGRLKGTLVLSCY
jgi:hypothetical protein